MVGPAMQKQYEKLLELVGEDVHRQGLCKTPERAAAAMRFLTSGYTTDLEEIVGDALFSCDLDEMVVIRGIEFYSLCEHHMLPFFGTCDIGYIPNDKVLGLSKFSRIVDLFSRRLQIQEGLTMQIANTIQAVTGCKGVGVVMTARHLCMMMRGVEKQSSTMSTSCMLGCLKDSSVTRAEFFNLISRS
jgi:GTP cyclohydrolase I